MNSAELEASLVNHIQDPKVKKFNNLCEKLIALNDIMKDDSIVNNAVEVSLFKNHDKAPQMLNLLYKLHGSKNITREGAINLVFGRLKECGIDGHDGHFEILKADQVR